jgi:hypothetical protein
MPRSKGRLGRIPVGSPYTSRVKVIEHRFPQPYFIFALDSVYLLSARGLTGCYGEMMQGAYKAQWMIITVGTLHT